MFDKINARHLKIAGLLLGVIGAGIASITQTREIEAAVDKALDKRGLTALELLDEVEHG